MCKFHCWKLMMLAVASSFLVTETANAAFILIDDFSTGAQTVADPDFLGATATDSAAGSMLGGERDLLVKNETGAPGSESVIARVNIVAELQIYSEPNTEDGFAEVIWDGVDGSPTIDTSVGLGGIDITDGGENKGIIIAGLTADHPTELKMTIWSSPTESSTVLIPVPATTATTVFLSWASFNVAGSGGFANLTAVTAIGLWIDSVSGGLGTDVTLTMIAAVVPEPTSMAIMGLGTLLAGFGVRRRKRKLAEMVA